MPLNDNFKDNDIKLFPRVRCKWERTSRGKNTDVRLDNYIYYLLIFPFLKNLQYFKEVTNTLKADKSSRENFFYYINERQKIKIKKLI